MTRIEVLESLDAPTATIVVDLHERTATVAYAHIFDTPFPREDSVARWSTFQGRVALALDEVTVDSPEMSSIPLGFAAWHRDSLDALYVLPEAAGRGLGARLLETATGATRLWVMAENTAARAFYERMGWRPSGQGRPGYPGAPEIEYVREV